MSFFEAMDRLVGTDNYEKHKRSKTTVDVLLVSMTQIARLFCLGVLVIDEIQHLDLAKSGGTNKMLNFFVTLVNTIGIPVVLIGTNKAKPILQSEFRQARRGSGQGDLLWDRMKNNVSWRLFVSSMWKSQWTREQVELTSEISDVLYDESQGITDLAVKLYAMVQIRNIALGKESFAPKDFHIVAGEKLGLVKPMLDALRTGNKKKIEMYDDIAPINIDDYFLSYLNMVTEPDKVPKKRSEISLTESAVLKLLELGVDPIEAKQLVGKTIACHLEAKTVPEVVRMAYSDYVMKSPVPPNASHLQGDLRSCAGYDELKVGNVIGVRL